VAPSVLYEQDNVDLNIAGQPVAEVGVQSAEASLDLGRNLGSWGEIRAGYGYKSARASPSIGLPGLLPESAQVEGGALSVELNLDTLDSLTFPRHGAIGGLEWRVEESPFEGDDQKSLLEGGLALPATRGALTVLTSVEGGVTFEGELPFGAEFQLGGFRRLSGLAPNSISGNHYALAVLQPYWQLSQRSSLFGIARYVGMTLEYGGVWQDLAGLEADDMNVGASVYLGFDTLVGSAFLGFGTSEGGHTSAYVFIGPVL
jgi:NTE family protein